VAEFNNSSSVAIADFLVVVDEDLCIACGDCLDRCQFNALEVSDTCVVDSANCVGCGLCVPACPEEAMVLIRREEGLVAPPPENIKDWGKQRSR
jgi:NAD-dependent dihydropyrimidine dehydrogenase PreA subunit